MRNIFWSMTLVVACLFGAATAQAQKQVTTNNAIVPGEVWNDTDGNPINAHGGGILYHEGTYYWYGEYKKGKTILPEWATWECYRTDVTGELLFIQRPSELEVRRHRASRSEGRPRPRPAHQQGTGTSEGDL